MKDDLWNDGNVDVAMLVNREQMLIDALEDGG